MRFARAALLSGFLTSCSLLTPLDGYGGSAEPPSDGGAPADGPLAEVSSGAESSTGDARADAGGASDVAFTDGTGRADANEDRGPLDGLDASGDRSVDADGDRDASDAGEAGRAETGPPDGGPPIGHIAFRISTAQESTLSSIVVPAPITVEQDFLWLTLYTDLSNTSIIAADGWKPQGNLPNPSANFHSWWFYRIATANEPTEYVISLSQATESAASIVVYSGVSPTRPIATSVNQTVTGSPFTAPSIDTTAAGQLLLASFIDDEGAGGSWAIPMDGHLVRSSSPFIFVTDQELPVPGPTAPIQLVHTNDGQGSVALTILNPVGTP